MRTIRFRADLRRAPEIFTHGESLAWLARKLGGARDHLAFSDGSTVRILPGMRNHVFFYAQSRLSDGEALARLERRAGELLAGLDLAGQQRAEIRARPRGGVARDDSRDRARSRLSRRAGTLSLPFQPACDRGLRGAHCRGRRARPPRRAFRRPRLCRAHRSEPGGCALHGGGGARDRAAVLSDLPRDGASPADDGRRLASAGRSHIGDAARARRGRSRHARRAGRQHRFRRRRSHAATIQVPGGGRGLPDPRHVRILAQFACVLRALPKIARRHPARAPCSRAIRAAAASPVRARSRMDAAGAQAPGVRA